MNRIAETCGLPFVFENINLKIGASIGLAIFPEDAQSVEQLMDSADVKMYANKRARKG